MHLATTPRLYFPTMRSETTFEKRSNNLQFLPRQNANVSQPAPTNPLGGRTKAVAAAITVERTKTQPPSPTSGAHPVSTGAHAIAAD